MICVNKTTEMTATEMVILGMLYIYVNSVGNTSCLGTINESKMLQIVKLVFMKAT